MESLTAAPIETDREEFERCAARAHELGQQGNTHEAGSYRLQAAAARLRVYLSGLCATGVGSWLPWPGELAAV